MAAPAVLIGGDGSAAMGVRYVVICVAGGAIGHVCRAGPGYSFTVGGMARTAGQRHAVIAGIVARGVHEVESGRPRRGRVAHVTLLGSDKVAGIFAGCSRAVVAG